MNEYHYFVAKIIFFADFTKKFHLLITFLL